MVKKNSTSNKIKKNSKPNFYEHHANNIITLNNCLNNKHKIKTKNQLLRNSINLYSNGVSLIKTKDSKDNINSEYNFSKSGSKKKNSNMNIKTNNNLKVNHTNKISFNRIDKTNKKILKKLKTVSPFGNTYNSRNNKKNQENSNICSSKKSNYCLNNKTKKKNIPNNKSLDNQKVFFKKKKINNTSVKTKDNMLKTKSKIISRNTGSNNINNNLIKNNTNVKLNTKDIFNNKLNNLTISNINKLKEQLSRNIFNNLSYYPAKSKKTNIMNNTNSYMNNRDYLKIINNANKNKGIYFTNINNNNNSNLLKKGTALKCSKSKNIIYLKNNFFNRPVKKLNKKKN